MVEQERPVEDWPFVPIREWTPAMREHVHRLVYGGCGDFHANCPCSGSVR